LTSTTSTANCPTVAAAPTASKLAKVLFTYQLVRRIRGSAVAANAPHPDVVRTSFGAEDPACTQRLLLVLLRPVMKSPVQGAATSIHLTSALELEEVSGRYFANRRATKSSTRSNNHQAVAARLWRRARIWWDFPRHPVCETAGHNPRNESLGAEGDPVAAGLTRNENPVRPTRVLIVDDHAPFRSIARQVLTADGFDIVGEAADGAEAIRAFGVLRPDLVLLDVQLPDIDGFAVATVLTSRIHPPTVVLVSSRSPTDYGSQIEDCHAHGYITKAELSGDAVRRLLSVPNRVPPAGP
jgi:CheY-like chemotaxis protein